MTDHAEHIADLIVKHLHGELSLAEQQELDAWRGSDDQRESQFSELTSSVSMRAMLRRYEEYDDSGLAKQLHVRFPGMTKDQKSAGADAVASSSSYRLHFLRNRWFRYAAAIIILLGVGAYLWLQPSTDKLAITHIKPVPVKNDIQPGSNRAVLTLSNGNKVELDSAASQTIIDGDLSIENNNGQLKYKKGELVAVNTMTTPKGGQYQLTLADGTRVWLNAASSITYPTVFTGRTREVRITGEAYFEVTRNPKQPFVVKTPKENITVVGTQFNVSTYPDEPASKISLLEGAVKVNQALLRPGQAFTNGKIIETNTQQDVAWKNGAFSFNNVTIEQMMRQISRWYDVEIVYEGKPRQKTFVGEMGRNLRLQQVRKLLNDLGIKTKLEGKKLMVTN